MPLLFIEYQVQINLHDAAFDHIVGEKHTTFQAGQNPIWNEAFHIDLESDELNEYYLVVTGKSVSCVCLV